MSKLDDFLAQLKSSDETDRRYAVEDLTDLGDPACLQELCSLLFDRSAGVRETVIDCLPKFDAALVAPQLIPVVASEDVPARNAALDVYVALGAKCYPAVHQGMLLTDSVDLKKFGLDLILRVGDLDAERDAEMLKTITNCMSDENENVSGAAMEVLASGRGLIQPSTLVAFMGKGVWLETNALMALENLGAESELAQLQSREAELNLVSRAVLKKLVRRAG